MNVYESTFFILYLGALTLYVCVCVRQSKKKGRWGKKTFFLTPLLVKDVFTLCQIFVTSQRRGMERKK